LLGGPRGRMKIALVDDTVYGYASADRSAAGGAERYMWLLTRAMVASGWSAIVGVRAGLKAGERVRIDGVEFVGIGQSQMLVALYRFFTSERPDWCHWFGAQHLLGPAVAIGRLTGTRTVFSAQFDLDVRPREALSGRPRLWPFYAWGLIGSSRIFLQHAGQYHELPPRWRSKAYIVPGIVNLPGSVKPHAVRDRYVAWIGVLRKPKRADLLIDIARRLPSVEFVVCGGPSLHRSPPGYGERIIRSFKELRNIHYLGHVPPDRAIEIIGGAALLLSTSDGEGFPSVFLEAWASGTPVVSLKIDPDRLIATRKLGLICDGVEAAAGGILTLVESWQERQEIALRSREYVAQFHTGTAAVAAVERALQSRSAPILQPFQSVGGS
jgi:glycosyltransferase involved in cell wall biosynthesis